MIQKIRDLDKRLEEKFKPYSLANKFPGYFTKRIFHAAIILFFVVIAAVFVQQGFTLRAIDVYCPESSTRLCQNPVYDCSYSGPENYVEFCPIVPSQNDRPAQWVCDIAPCDKPFLNPGDHYSNAGWFIRHAYSLLFYIFVAAFAGNHLYYRMRTGNWTYVRPQ